MRETLFRGKRVDNDEWAVSGDIFLGGKRKYIYIPNPDTDMSAKAYLCREVIPETVGQFTGLKAYWDEFEEEADIWEHDILEVTYENKQVIAKVEFEAGMFILCSNEFPDSYIPLFDVVVIEDDYHIEAKKIGNIHDNPELLKEGVNNDL